MNRRTLCRALAAASCAGALTRPYAARAQATTLRIGATFADGFAEPYYADAQGTFKKAGFDVQITKFSNGPTMMPALLGGALDVGISDTVSLGGAIGKDLPFVLIAGSGMYRAAEPEDALCIALDSPIKTAQDLINKPVGILGLHAITEIALWSWLDRNHINNDQLKYVELPLTQMAGTIARGGIAAGFLAEPFLSQNRDKTVRVLSHPFDAIAPEFLVSNWFTSKGFLRQNGDAVKRLVEVIYETAQWANANHKLTAPILADVTKVPLETINGTVRVTYGTSMDARLIDPVFNAMYKFGIIPRRLTTAEVIA